MSSPSSRTRSDADAYWRSRDPERTRARSRERARAAVELLRWRGVSGGRVLEAGCGPGWALEVFREAGFDAVGLDASGEAVGSARSRDLEVRELDLETASAEEIFARAGVEPLDVVAALEFLEHVRRPLEVLRGLGALVEPGGHLVVSLPNEIHAVARLRIVAGRLPFGGHSDPHVRHFDLRGARKLLEAAGLRTLATRRMSIVPPRHPVLRGGLGPLVRALPGLFSISTVYLIEGPRRATA